MADTPTIQLDEAEVLADQPETDQLNEETQDVEQPTAEESSDSEKKAEAGTDDEEPSEDTETESDEEEGDQKDAEDTDKLEAKDDQPKKNAEARKEELTREIRALVAQRNTERQRVAELTSQHYRPATADELIAQGEDPALAHVKSLEQRTQMAEFNAQVADLNANMNTEALQVMHDYPIFDKDSPNFNPELASLARTEYTRVAGQQTDPKTGLVYGLNALPYSTYETIAKAYEAGKNTGKVSGQRAADTMLANVDTPTSVAPPKPKEDPFLTGLTRNLRG